VKVVEVLAEQKVELLEESGVQRKGLVEQGQTKQRSWSSTGVWIGMLYLPTVSGQSITNGHLLGL